METTNSPQDKQQSWLERLSTESWQAEMVISGVAIFGSFQLFDAVNSLIDWFYFHLPGSFLQIAYFLAFYLIIAAAVLSMSFLGHFIIRSIWIASIGLESVYPEIRRENETYTTHFMDQFSQRFPSFKSFNEELDQVGSSILAFALMFVMTFIGIGVVISLCLLIGVITTAFLEEEIAVKVSLGILMLIGVIVFFNAFLNNDKVRDRPWVRKIHYPLTLAISMLSANIFYRPHSYLSFTIRTNLNPKRYWKFMTVVMTGVVFIGISIFQSTHLFALMDDVYYRYDLRTDRLYSTNYLAESKDSKLAFIRPQIPAQVLHSPADLTLFLPMPKRESRKIFLACSDKEPEGIEDREEARLARYAYRQNCFREQIIIEIDQQVITYIVKTYTHPHRSEPGLQYFFPDLELSPGEHELTIRHLALKGELEKTDRIPFIYLPKK